MKKIFTLGLVLLSAEFVVAQPIITSAYNPIFGDIYVYKTVIDTGTAQVGQAGAGVVWNLASMHGELTTRQYNWMQTALTNDSAIFFPISNLAAEIIQNGVSPVYEFYHVGNNFLGDMKKAGSHVDNSITKYTYGSGYLQLDYPVSYGQSCTDTMDGTSGSAFVHGNATTTYDGHGTLQLEAQSGGNFSNVARLKFEANYVLDYGPLKTHHVETYFWMDNTTSNLKKQPIVIISTHEWTDLNGDFKREKVALIRQVLFFNEVPHLTLTASNVSVSPNPFHDNLTFSLPGIDSEIDIQLSDITGRVIRNLHLNKSFAAREEIMHLSDLIDGVYFAKISSRKGSVVKKIVKD